MGATDRVCAALDHPYASLASAHSQYKFIGRNRASVEVMKPFGRIKIPTATAKRFGRIKISNPNLDFPKIMHRTVFSRIGTPGVPDRLVLAP